MTKKQQILSRLLDGYEHPNRELNRIAFAYPRCLMEMRDAGLDIETISVDPANGLYHYQLHTPPYLVDLVKCAIRIRPNLTLTPEVQPC